MHEDPFDPARGILFASTLGIALWTAVAIAVWSL